MAETLKLQGRWLALADVENIQYEIVQVARKLEEEGKIIINQGAESGYV